MSQTPKLQKKYLKSLVHFYAITKSLPQARKLDNKYSPNRPGQTTLFLFVFICFLIVLGIFDYYSVNFVSCYYPIVMSINALRTNLQPERQRWLSYWIIYMFTIVFYSPLKLVFGFLPFYQLWRFGFYIILFHPNINLAHRIYSCTISKMIKTKDNLKKETAQRQKYLDKRTVLSPLNVKKTTEV